MTPDDELMPHTATPDATDRRPPDVEVEVPSPPPDEDEATDLELTPLPDLSG